MSIGDVFDISGTPHIVTIERHGFVDGAIPLRQYIEINRVIRTEYGAITIKEYLDKLVDKYTKPGVVNVQRDVHEELDDEYFAGFNSGDEAVLDLCAHLKNASSENVAKVHRSGELLLDRKEVECLEQLAHELLDILKESRQAK